LPLMHEGSLRPGADHHLERLRHALAAVVAPKAVADKLVLVVVAAVADADVTAPARPIGEEAEPDGQWDRVTQRKVDHREAEADARGPRGDHAGEGNRVAVDALAREVVLGEPDAVKARGLREARLFDLLVDGGIVPLRGGRESERQPAESHGRVL